MFDRQGDANVLEAFSDHESLRRYITTQLRALSDEYDAVPCEPTLAWSLWPPHAETSDEKPLTWRLVPRNVEHPSSIEVYHYTLQTSVDWQMVLLLHTDHFNDGTRGVDQFTRSASIIHAGQLTFLKFELHEYLRRAMSLHPPLFMSLT